MGTTGNLTVTRGLTTTFAKAFSAENFTQTAGQTATNFQGLIDVETAFDFNGAALTITGAGTNDVGGTMSVTNTGLFTLDEASLLTVGTLTQDGSGSNVIGDNITADTGGITFAETVTLTSGTDNDTIVFTTSANSQAINFDDTGNSILIADNENLTLVAGNAGADSGNIGVDGVVDMGTAGNLTVTRGLTTTFAKAFSAENFTQTAGQTATNFQGLIDVETAFDFNGAALTITGAGTNDVGGTMSVTNTGLFTLDEASLLTVGTLTQDGSGSNVIGDNITADTGGITFAETVTLTSGTDNDTIVFTTSANSQAINFDDTGNSILIADNENLTLVAGNAGANSGNIGVDGVVDMGTTGNLTVTRGLTTTFAKAFSAENFTQTAGQTATNFQGLIDVETAFDFNGAALTITGAGTNDVGGTMSVTNTGLFTLDEASLLTVGTLTQDGSGSNGLIGDNITADTGGITFAETVTLTSGTDNDTIVFTTSANSQAINFDDTGNSILIADNENLTLVAGNAGADSGNIGVDGVVNMGTTGNLTVTRGLTTTFAKAFSAENFTQTAGQTATNFQGLIDVETAFDFNGAALTITGAGTNDVGGTMSVTNTGLFTLDEASLLTVGTLTQDGSGSNVIGDNITADTGGITFAETVTLTITDNDTIVFTTSANSQAINFDDTGNSSLQREHAGCR